MTLELLIDQPWGKEHPGQATAKFMESVRRHLGLDNRRGESVPQPKPAPKTKRERRRRATATYAAPLAADGETMIKIAPLAAKIGISPITLRGWIGKGDFTVVRQREGGGSKRLYLCESQVRDYMATKRRRTGRPRKEG
jgi:hypothetical protein